MEALPMTEQQFHALPLRWHRDADGTRIASCPTATAHVYWQGYGLAALYYTSDRALWRRRLRRFIPSPERQLPPQCREFVCDFGEGIIFFDPSDPKAVPRCFYAEGRP